MIGPPLVDPAYGTLNETLRAAAASSSGLTFVDFSEHEATLPFVELYARARRAAAALRALGVKRGERVALVLATSVEFMDAFFGTLLSGAIPVPLYPPMRLGRLDEYYASTAKMLCAVQACLVLADRETRKLLGQVIERSRPRLGCCDAAKLVRESEGALEESVEPDGLAFIQFSSGSTTNPKPVALTHENLMAQLAILRSILPPEERFPHLGVSWLPLYHDMGLIGCLLLALYYPGPLVLIRPEHFLVRPALWLRAIARHRATLSMAPSFAYALCARRIADRELAGADLSSWCFAPCGAEPVSRAILERFGERFARFGFEPSVLRPVYGLAEASLAVTVTDARRPMAALSVDPARLAGTGEVAPGTRPVVSVGRAVPGTQVEVRGANDSALPERRLGRIFTRGPSVMKGYFGLPEITAKAFSDGWLDTGDLGFVAEGELYVCGRSKDVIILRGANHVPQEFEECLDGVEGVRPGCAVAVGFVPDGEDAEALLILAERAREADAAADETLAERVRQAVSARTGIRPHTVQVLAPGSLPRTSSGKLRRAEALRRYLAAELAAPRRAGAGWLLLELLRSILAFARVKGTRRRSRIEPSHNLEARGQ